MTPHNHPANVPFHDAADIPVDNPPRDPQAVVKRGTGRKPKYATARDRQKARIQSVLRCQNRYRVLAVRLKRIAAARGMTAEALLDEMERG